MTEYEAKLAADLFDAARVAAVAFKNYQDAMRATASAKKALEDAERARKEALDALRDYRPEEP